MHIIDLGQDMLSLIVRYINDKKMIYYLLLSCKSLYNVILPLIRANIFHSFVELDKKYKNIVRLNSSTKSIIIRTSIGKIGKKAMGRINKLLETNTRDLTITDINVKARKIIFPYMKNLESLTLNNDAIEYLSGRTHKPFINITSLTIHASRHMDLYLESLKKLTNIVYVTTSSNSPYISFPSNITYVNVKAKNIDARMFDNTCLETLIIDVEYLYTYHQIYNFRAKRLIVNNDEQVDVTKIDRCAIIIPKTSGFVLPSYTYFNEYYTDIGSLKYMY
jgi:hypothetical protein